MPLASGLARPSNAAEIAAGEKALELAARRREQLVNALIPLTRELAERSPNRRITVADVRLLAQQRRILPKVIAQRDLSFLPHVMPRAGLRATTEFQRSFIVGTHGNLNRVWELP